MNLQHRSHQAELLDGDDIPFADIQKNMQELNTINTLLGGHAITVKGIAKLIGDRKQICICEIGCGGGDNLLAINTFCKKNDIEVQFFGIDIKDTCIAFAKTRTDLQMNTTWVTSDYKLVKFNTKPDIIFSSLFCHHFTNEQLVQQLQWMQANATIGFFINDLQRSSIAYYAIKIITQLFSSSYLVKNDAPLSVARAFTKADWIAICTQAAISPITIKWQWAFRYLIIHQAK